MISRWSEATGKLDHYVRVALLDFSEAFDLINHNILLGLTIASLLNFSFLIRSFLVLPSIHLNMFISVVCVLCCSALCSAQHSPPYYIKVGLMTVLYSLFFSLTGTFYSSTIGENSQYVKLLRLSNCPVHCVNMHKYLLMSGLLL